MKKLAKVIACVAAVAACACTAVAFAACGGSEDITGTYTFKMTVADGFSFSDVYYGAFCPDEIAQSTDGMVNTVTLNDDGTYVYTKSWSFNGKSEVDPEIYGVSEVESNATVTYTYYGDWTNDGNTVTLNMCTKMDYYEDWYDNGFIDFDCSGTGVTDKTTQNVTGCVIFDTFDGMYLNTYYITNQAQQIVISSNGTFTYVEED